MSDVRQRAIRLSGPIRHVYVNNRYIVLVQQVPFDPGSSVVSAAPDTPETWDKIEEVVSALERTKLRPLKEAELANVLEAALGALGFMVRT